MISLTVFVSLALIPFAAAQASSPAFEIEAIKAHFTQSAIVPSLLAAFEPTALLSLNYEGVGDITPGQELTKEQVGPTPTVTITPVNSTVTLTGDYTIAMVDAGPVGSDISEGVTRHWLLNKVTIADGKVDNATATAITRYAGPWPAAGSGPHRYVVILYAQPETFTPPAAFSEADIGVAVFDVNAYAKDSGLGPIVAANYISVEEGTSTASFSATSAVVTSTLPPVSAGGSSAVTSTATAPGSGSSNTSAPNSAVGLKAGSVLSLALTGFMLYIGA